MGAAITAVAAQVAAITAVAAQVLRLPLAALVGTGGRPSPATYWKGTSSITTT